MSSDEHGASGAGGIRFGDRDSGGSAAARRAAGPGDIEGGDGGSRGRGSGGMSGGSGAVWAVIVAVGAVLPYMSAFGNEFVRDDLVIIRDNARIRSFAGVLECFTTNYWGDAVACGLYRPLVLASYAANYALGGLDTTGYTAVNVALHAGCSLALLALVGALGAGRFAAGAAALLFAVHPVHTESVTGFVGRADVLSTLLVLLALLLHRRVPLAPPGRARLLGVATGVCFLAALLSKESAITALLLAPLLDLLAPVRDALGRPARPGWRTWRDLLPLALAAAVFLVLRAAVVGPELRDPMTIDPVFNPTVPARVTALGEVRGAAPGESLPTALAALVEYARVLVWPARLSVSYDHAQIPLVTRLSDPRWLLGAGIVLVHAAGAILVRRRAPLAAIGLAWTGIAFSVTSNVAFPIGTLCAERLLYLPSAGFVMVCGAGLAALGRCAVRGRSLRPLALALLVLVALAGALRTAVRNRDWRTPVTLWTAAVRATPDSVKSHASLGFALMRAADGPADPRLRRALEHLEHAASVWPEQFDVNRAIASIRWALGAPDPLVDTVYPRLVVLEPRPADAYAQWGGAYLARAARQSGAARSASAEEARARIATALELDPRSADAHYYMGVLRLDHDGDAAAAGEHWREVLRRAPDHWARATIESRLGERGGSR